ncbi:MAG: ERCC4 domain-containing protein [Nanoarchaeota archaeon]
MAFYNIFKKTRESKKNKEQEKSKITIDNREKNSLVPSYLAEKGYQIEWQQLPIGDYIANNTAIERKTISDLKSSIINKRIMHQLSELKQYPSSLLIIEGPIEELYNNQNINSNAMRGFLLFLATKEKIPFIFSSSEQDTSDFIDLIMRKKTKTDIPLNPKKIILGEKERIQFILEGFPGIGPAKAKKLLEKFHSLENIFLASEEQLEKIIGHQAKSFKSLISFIYHK